MKKEKQQKNNGGFTLVELMVASSIFAMIMLVSIGALLTTFGTAKNSRALRIAMDNVNFAMESMTRSIRTGTDYTCIEQGGSVNISGDDVEPLDCPNGGILIAFTPQQGSPFSRVAYQLSDNTLKRYDNLTPTGVPIVSSDVEIEQLNFIVNGSPRDDNIQASVYIIMKGTVTVKGNPISFAIQTMASQRNF